MPVSISYGQGVTSAWASIATFVPKLVAATIGAGAKTFIQGSLGGLSYASVLGNGIRTMSARWEPAASRYDQEKIGVQQQVRSAPGLTDQAQQARHSMRSDVPGGSTPPPYDR